MSPIGAVIIGVLLITGMMFAAGNYTQLGFSRNTWIAVNALLFAVLVIYEIVHNIRSKNESEEEIKKEDTTAK